MKKIPVKTRILTQKDDIIKTICQYAGDQIGPDDIVTVAESVLAITQGRMKRPEEMEPSLVAKVLCRFFPQKGSISNWASMQALIEEEGTMRVLTAFIVGSLGKIVGKSGLFYQLVGEQGKLIDDMTGTVPPFDKHIVYGPKDASTVADSIRIATGSYGAAIVDANDLKKVAIVGMSSGINPDKLTELLLDNPFGNDNQKTPIVIIKNYSRFEQHTDVV